jgi:predicted branched-subunit amino acid permease
MGASVRRLVPTLGLGKRIALPYVLTDETFGLTVRAAEAGEPHPDDYMLGANLTLATGWVLGTAAGVAFGEFIDVEAVSASVLFPLLFLGLAREWMNTRRELITALAAGVAALIAVFVLPAAWRITAAAVATAAIAASLPTRSEGAGDDAETP